MRDIIITENLSLWYAQKQVLKNISMRIKEHAITTIMGPSGCGKTTLLRTFNRMNDLIEHSRIEGRVIIDGQDIYDEDINVFLLRKKIGMVFQKPNPFPKSVFENVAYGLRIHGIKNKRTLNELVEKALRDTNLWDEVNDRLYDSALELSGGQQQRLCIARAIAIEPEIILMDEPASALDPVSTQRLEELIERLKTKYTIVIVTHNIQQAARVSDYAAFILNGELVEFDTPEVIFTRPKDERTERYLTGKFG